ncbi:MAG: phosphatase PAP2 family protein [Pseudomonadota bacterium]
MPHAGGSNSPLLSAAINLTRDGIVGAWDTSAGAITVPPGGLGSASDADTGYLRRGTRGVLFDHQLIPSISVDIDGDQVTVSHRGARTQQPLATVVKPNDTTLKAQLPYLKTYADLRQDRIAEINLQASDLMSFFGAIGYIDNARRVKTGEVMDAVFRMVVTTEMQVKHLARTLRPIDLSPQVQPVIQTPDHSAYPSGHATEAYIIATVLDRLMTGRSAAAGLAAGAQVYRLAYRIASNRTVAGVHFPMDSAAGAVLGCALGEHLFRLAIGFPGREPLPTYDPNVDPDDPSQPRGDFGPNDALGLISPAASGLEARTEAQEAIMAQMLAPSLTRSAVQPNIEAFNTANAALPEADRISDLTYSAVRKGHRDSMNTPFGAFYRDAYAEWPKL